MEQEYYIRQNDIEDSRGPFTVDQLASLAEAGQIDDQTFIYDVEKEIWDELANLPELKSALFPEKRKLNLKPKEQIARLNPDEEGETAITVDEMLAQAEGRTKETRHSRNLDELKEKLAYVGMHVAAVIFLLSGLALFIPDMGLLFSFDLEGLMLNPLVIVGVVDLVIALILFLRTSGVYPFIRFRAAFGIGFFSILHFSHGDPVLVASAVLGSIGLYLCTITAALPPLAVATLIGLGGMGTYAYIILLT